MVGFPTELAVAVTTSTVAAVGSIVCALIASRNGQRAEKAASDAADYRRDRERLDVAKWKVLVATMEGVTVLLHQAKGEKLNGNVEAALDRIQDAEDGLNDVQAELLARIVQ